MAATRKGRQNKDERLLVIACGMIAREVLAVKEQLALDHLELTCLPAEFHYYPDRIPPAMDKAIAAGDYQRPVAAAHGVREVHAPAVTLIHVGQRSSHTAFRHHGVRLAEQ